LGSILTAQNNAKIVPKMDPKMEPTIQIFLVTVKMEPKMVPKMMPIPELLQNDHQMVPTWYENHPKRTPKSNPQ